MVVNKLSMLIYYSWHAPNPISLPSSPVVMSVSLAFTFVLLLMQSKKLLQAVLKLSYQVRIHFVH